MVEYLNSVINALFCEPKSQLLPHNNHTVNSKLLFNKISVSVSYSFHPSSAVWKPLPPSASQKVNEKRLHRESWHSTSSLPGRASSEVVRLTKPLSLPRSAFTLAFTTRNMSYIQIMRNFNEDINLNFEICYLPPSRPARRSHRYHPSSAQCFLIKIIFSRCCWTQPAAAEQEALSVSPTTSRMHSLSLLSTLCILPGVSRGWRGRHGEGGREC